MSDRTDDPAASTADDAPNQVRCPTCGRVRLETPPGTTALPTLGVAMRASGAVGACDCGRAPHEPPDALTHEPGRPGGPGTTSAEPSGAAQADPAATRTPHS